MYHGSCSSGSTFTPLGPRGISESNSSTAMSAFARRIAARALSESASCKWRSMPGARSVKVLRLGRMSPRITVWKAARRTIPVGVPVDSNSSRAVRSSSVSIRSAPATTILPASVRTAPEWVRVSSSVPHSCSSFRTCWLTAEGETWSTSAAA